jgi:hypothetical protein
MRRFFGAFGSFGVGALAWVVSACSSPADEVNDAPTLTFAVQNDSGVDLSTSSNWIEIDSDFQWLWDSTAGNYGGSPCDKDIKDYGGLPPDEPQLAAGEHALVRWKENAFTGSESPPSVLFEAEGCLKIERVPTGSHTFNFCARQRGVECVISPTEQPRDPQPACLTLTIVLTDNDISRDVVFRPETLPVNCPTGTERHL